MEECTRSSMERSMEFGRRGSILKRRDVVKNGLRRSRYLNDLAMVLLSCSLSCGIANKFARSTSSLS